MQRREHERKQVVFASEMHFDNRELPCNIVNISAGGAKLKISGEHENEFSHSAALNISPFGRFAVTIVWQSGKNLGVKFHDDPDKMVEVLIAMAVY